MEERPEVKDNNSDLPVNASMPSLVVHNTIPLKRSNLARQPGGWSESEDAFSASDESTPLVLNPVGSSASPETFTEPSKPRDPDVESGFKGHHNKKQQVNGSQALLSGLAYCLSSCSMILLNKIVLSSFKWEAQISLMLYQNFVSVLVVIALARFGFIQTDPLSWQLVQIWLPVNVIFVGMLVTSFFSLQYMQVAMVMVLKNMTNIVTAVGEMYLFRKKHTAKVWGSLFLMVFSALCGGITDLSFHPVGYSWQILNCLFTAAYSLTLRRVMDKAKAASLTGRLSEFTMVLLNNSLSFPLGFVLVFLLGETKYLTTTPLLQSSLFWVAATVSGLMGLSISFSSMWFLHETSPTTYSLVGSLNKIPLSVAGILMFKAPMSLPNLGSIMFGCFAGILFARAKLEK